VLKVPFKLQSITETYATSAHRPHYFTLIKVIVKLESSYIWLCCIAHSWGNRYWFYYK